MMSLERFPFGWKKPVRIFRQKEQYKFSNHKIRRDECVSSDGLRNLPVERTVSFHFPPKQPRIISRSMGIERKREFTDPVKTRKEVKRPVERPIHLVSFLLIFLFKDLW